MADKSPHILSKAYNAFLATTLSADAKSVRADRLTYLSPQKLRRLERCLAAVLRQGVQGDVLEFGVALGGSSILLAKAAKRTGRRFCGFDVFATIPPPASRKDDDKSRTRYETIVSGRSEGIGGDIYYGYRADLYADVCDAFDRHGIPVDGEAVALHKGLFEETWSSHRPQSVAFAHIDCDWYDPVRFTLAGVRDCLAVGGVILLDDFHDYGGCRTATEEFLADNPRYRMENGPSVLLRRVG